MAIVNRQWTKREEKPRTQNTLLIALTERNKQPAFRSPSLPGCPLALPITGHKALCFPSLVSLVFRLLAHRRPLPFCSFTEGKWLGDFVFKLTALTSHSKKLTIPPWTRRHHLKLPLAGGKPWWRQMLFVYERQSVQGQRDGEKYIKLCCFIKMWMAFCVKISFHLWKWKYNRLVCEDLTVPIFTGRDKTQFLNVKGITLQARLPTSTAH